MITDYYDYPVVTNINLDHKAQVTFPAITICNLNRIHCLNLLTSFSTMNEQLDGIDNATAPAAYGKLAGEVNNIQNIFYNTGCNEQVRLTKLIMDNFQ